MSNFYAIKMLTVVFASKTVLSLPSKNFENSTVVKTINFLVVWSKLWGKLLVKQGIYSIYQIYLESQS